MQNKRLKKPPIEVITVPVRTFLLKEYSAGLVLMLSVVAALVWANSPFAHSYHEVWLTELGISLGDWGMTHSLHMWINDGLMAIFFFVIGLELKREFMAGELSTPRKALLPMVAAVGGMIFPAAIYLFFNYNTDSQHGWGIPMATDIAFALALLSLAGRHIPIGIKVFLSALAVADDLGAVLVIAFFYTDAIMWLPLLLGFAGLVVMMIGNLVGIRSVWFYATFGIAVWVCFLLSGVHATIAGVLCAFAIPANTKIDENVYANSLRVLAHNFESEIPLNSSLTTASQHHTIEQIKQLSMDAETPLQKMEHALHDWVAYLIMPVFALSNAGVHFGEGFLAQLINPISIGIFFGLLIGKFTGIFGFTWLLVRVGFVQLPKDSTWKQLAGVSLLAGVGFTMSLFISNLAFNSPVMVEDAKYGILITSIIAGTLGLIVLKSCKPKGAVAAIE